MRTYTTVLGSFAVMIGLLVLPAGVTEAAQFEAGEEVHVTSDETAEDDLYTAGGLVNITGSVLGDVLTAGGNVTINSDVSDDLHVVGGTINVPGDVGEDLRLGGGVINVSGSIGDDVVIAGGQTQLTSDQVNGDVSWAGETLNLTADVDGDVQLIGKEARLSSSVAGDASFRGEKLILQDGAEIDGKLDYESPQKAEIQDGAAVSGEISYEQTQKSNDSGSDAGDFVAFGSVLALTWLLMRAAGALVVGLGLHTYTQDAVDTAFRRPWKQLGKGIVGLIAIPILAGLLLATIIGVPLGVAGLFTYGVLVVLAMLLAPILLGAMTYEWLKQTGSYKVDWLTILLGVLLFTLIGFVPVLGSIVQFVLVVLAFGAMMDVKWRIYQDYRNS